MKTAFLLVVLLAGTLSAQEVPLQNSGTKENLRGVSVVGKGIAWASGTHGTYLRTTDGGKSWQAAQVPGAEGLDFRDVEAFNAKLAYLLSAGPGEQSRIYKTTDAGQNWALQFTNKVPKGFWDCMAFWDRAHGIAVGDPVDGKFVLIATKDGGKTWKQLPSGNIPAAIPGEGAFAASGTCIAVEGKANVWFATGGKAARVFHSADRGKTWSVAETPIIHGSESQGIFSIAFRDSTHGVIAGGDYQHAQQSGPDLAFTSDGGVTWQLSKASPQPYFSAVAFDIRNDRVLAVGPALTLVIRGANWQGVADVGLNALSVSNTGEALAVGPKGTIENLKDRW